MYSYEIDHLSIIQESGAFFVHPSANVMLCAPEVVIGAGADVAGRWYHTSTCCSGASRFVSLFPLRPWRPLSAAKSLDVTCDQ